ncbi:hypothetical protein FBY04_103115 [Pseudomonas sp. SJZ080]|uniref:hypothetical protein n=1 Tax=Pseudomonas sp. SJZ080 TaxID=2572888 RepID=UPI00119BBB55|nr:hypothetical protein [Pseudomonas sp. SJZ080]TWC59133.1 hypothetical protein FBY04_103115 [Pseudomonas sp. SJZ080]
MNVDHKPTLIHRSSDRSIVHTLIQRDHGSFYIDRPKWPTISGRRYPSLSEFSAALRLMGLKPVQVAGS